MEAYLNHLKLLECLKTWNNEALKGKDHYYTVQRNCWRRLHVFGVDNALIKVLDPTFIGYAAVCEAPVANKCVVKVIFVFDLMSIWIDRSGWESWNDVQTSSRFKLVSRCRIVIYSQRKIPSAKRLRLLSIQIFLPKCDTWVNSWHLSPQVMNSSDARFRWPQKSARLQRWKYLQSFLPCWLHRQIIDFKRCSEHLSPTYCS